jgi:enoyl-CoA hydratase/carnithine racemase
MSYETILVEHVSPGLLRVTMNRPEVGNAKNTRMGIELLEVWSGLIADPGETRCVILTGAGDRIFSGGGDLKERRGMTDEQWRHQHGIFERARDALVACPVPVIAAVNGHAYGGGCETVLACDFAYAAATARFALPEVTRGIMPGAGGTQFLPRAAGERRAKEVILTGRPFSADEALAWGVVNRVCAPERLMAEVEETANAIAANAPISVRQAKKAIHVGMQVDLRRGLDFEIEAYDRLVHTEDRHEGVAAYNEKRRPVFKGR